MLLLLIVLAIAAIGGACYCFVKAFDRNSSKYLAAAIGCAVIDLTIAEYIRSNFL